MLPNDFINKYYPQLLNISKEIINSHLTYNLLHKHFTDQEIFKLQDINSAQLVEYFIQYLDPTVLKNSFLSLKDDPTFLQEDSSLLNLCLTTYFDSFIKKIFVDLDSATAYLNNKLCEIIDNQVTTSFINSLRNNNDRVGDSVNFEIQEIDVYNRNAAFAFINNSDLLISEPDESHGKMLSRILHWSDKYFFRPNKEDLKSHDITNYVFGHLIDDIAFIISPYTGDLTKCIELLKSSAYVCKVYTEPNHSTKITRLAKKM